MNSQGIKLKRKIINNKEIWSVPEKIDSSTQNRLWMDLRDSMRNSVELHNYPNHPTVAYISLWGMKRRVYSMILIHKEEETLQEILEIYNRCSNYNGCSIWGKNLFSDRLGYIEGDTFIYTGDMQR